MTPNAPRGSFKEANSFSGPWISSFTVARGLVFFNHWKNVFLRLFFFQKKKKMNLEPPRHLKYAPRLQLHCGKLQYNEFVRQQKNRSTNNLFQVLKHRPLLAAKLWEIKSVRQLTMAPLLS